MSGLLQGDLGPSYRYVDYSVAELIGLAFPYSLRLGVMAMALALVVGVGAGRRRWRHVGWGVVREMGVAWLTTMPAAAILAIVVLPLWWYLGGA